jgi:8-oxo-dGTP pyrophosphatase MutT (NUDIX family)
MQSLLRRLRRLTGHPRVAAAVCCRGDAGRLELALVSTRDGDRWTFPKGHREPGETLAAAAAREAAEEAGLFGRVDDGRLLTYRYPARRPGRDVRVAAFLLHVTEVGRPAETFRTVIWCDLDAGRRRLAEGRDGRHAAELARVVAAAAREAPASRVRLLGR